MNKLELISALKTEANISKAEAAKVVQIFFDNMADAMARESVSKSVACAAFSSRNTKDIRVGTPKPVKKSLLSLRSFHFSNPVKN